MEIKDLEPFVKSLNMEPKHLIMGKGRQVKWLVCKQANKYGQIRAVIYDGEGKAFTSIYINFDFNVADKECDEYFHSSNIRKWEGDEISYKNLMCKRDCIYDFKPDWKNNSQEKEVI